MTMNLAERTDGPVTGPPDGSARAAVEGDGQQFVTFHVEHEVFAFPMASVREIIRMPEVVRVPLSPPTLEGLANLRGQILPVINLRRRFQFPQTDYNDATRVVVVEQNGLVGFVVDRVASVMTVEPQQVEPIDVINTTIDTDLLVGILKNVAGSRMVMVLDISRLVNFDSQAFAAQSQRRMDEEREHGGFSTAHDGSSDERQLVSFVVDDQEYGFAIERVQEIVQAPEDITHVPNTSSQVLGVMTLRNRLLPLVSLRDILGLQPEPLSSHHRIVVTTLEHQEQQRGGAMVGIVTDAVKEVLRVPEKLVDGVPTFLARQQQANEIDAVCRLDEGKRLVSVLAVDKLFHHTAVQQALTTQQEAEKETDMESREHHNAEVAADDEEQLVVFRLAGEEYGVNIEAVQEIIRVPEQLTRVPHTVDSLEGVVNLRGQVLPVVDLRRRFSLESMERDERQRIVVFSLKGLYTGFIVDAVSEVLKVAKAAIEPVPHLSEEQARLMGRLANLEKQKRMILILDPLQLLDTQSLTALAKASGQTVEETEV
jgi:purine-binding chemotaxis protein CheW